MVYAVCRGEGAAVTRRSRGVENDHDDDHDDDHDVRPGPADATSRLVCEAKRLVCETKRLADEAKPRQRPSRPHSTSVTMFRHFSGAVLLAAVMVLTPVARAETGSTTTAAGTTTATTPVATLPSLEHCLDAASAMSFETRSARATAAQRGAESDQTVWQLLPRLSLRAGYTRNEPEVKIDIPVGNGEFKTAVITPHDQLDGTLQLDIPLVDVGGWIRVAQAGDLAEASQFRTDAAVATVQKSVARSWFALVAAHALKATAERSLTASEGSRDVVSRRLEAGLSTEVDVLRATAEVERSRQVLVGADVQIKSAARQLSTLTGEDIGGVPSLQEDDLHDEAPIDDATLTSLPAIMAARAERDAQGKAVLSSWTTLAPTINATATDRLTNAAGFGENNSLALGVALSWKLDGASVQVARAQMAASDGAAIREAQTVQAAHDELHDAWDRVQGELARAKAARAQQHAAAKAAVITRQRLEVGTATVLDSVIADRDAFAADVGRIEADVNVKLSRVLLRLAAGTWSTTTPTTSPTAATP